MTNQNETYIVFVTRDRTESTAVSVKAPYLEAAEEMALKSVYVQEMQGAVKWTLDEPLLGVRMYVSDVEKPMTAAEFFNEEDRDQ